MMMAPVFGGRRSSHTSTESQNTAGVSPADCGYGEAPGQQAGSQDSSSSSDWPDDASDKESLQSWAKEQQEKEEAEEEDLFATKEEQHLRRWFIVITIALLLVGVGVSIFTFYYLQGQEQETFEQTFANTAQAIMDGAGFRMKVIERALLSRSQQLTTFAVFTGSLWPFVSLPDFYVQGRNFLMETETEMIAWAPLVTTDRNLRAWEAYSTYMLEHSGWFPPTEVEERLKKQVERLEEQAKDRLARNRESAAELPNNESGLYVPLWQISPWMYNEWVNHNLTEQFEESISLLLRSKRPVWSQFLDIALPPNNTRSNVTFDGVYRNQTQPPDSRNPIINNNNETIVASFLFQPIFRSLRDHDVYYAGVTNVTEDQDVVVGIYMAAVQWNRFLAGLVPDGTPGVHLVLQNPWGQTLTYQVAEDGAVDMSVLVGRGDQHASEYNDLAESTNMTTRAVGMLPYQYLLEEQQMAQQQLVFDDDTVESSASRGARPHPPTEEAWETSSLELRQSTRAPTAAPAMDNRTTDDNLGSGHFEMTIYPTSDFEDFYTTNEPMIYTIILAAVVFFAIAVFFWYSRFVHNRQQKLVETANRTALVVKSLFPSNVRDRIMREAEESELKSKAKRKKAQQKLQLDGSNSERGSFGSTGMADRNPFTQGLVAGSSILGGISVGSVGSRYSRGRRKRRPSLGARARLDERRGSSEERDKEDNSRDFGLGTSSSQNNMGYDNPYGSKPIADHFSETTVLFADMVGFTAWSSVREPTSVFTLLETIYHAFDKVARKRGIFKVETIGDCYVAVCGLPVPRPDHAIAMSYFANDCLRKMNILVKKLEVSLGPDTADLAMRIGLHSGPVTAGVLRGEKSRFQLFGDTVNTAARMESNGKKDCIHISEATAMLLMNAGKGRWLTARKEKIMAKGKGEMQTYWLEVHSRSNFVDQSGRASRRPSGESGISDEDVSISIDDSNSGSDEGLPVIPSWESDESVRRAPGLGDRYQRLVDWNVDQLVSLLKKIVANRRGKGRGEGKNVVQSLPAGADFELRTDSSIMDEVTEVIPFPKPTIADLLVGETGSQHGDVELDEQAVTQLHDFMATVASMYNDNPFHSFAHASHVTMALITWLSRITPPVSDGSKENMYEAQLSGDWKRRSTPSKDMFALQSDPLTHFALVFAALIHDVEHSGVPNSQLVKEKAHVATIYNERSIHEQASVDAAFETLMNDRYSQLRNVLFTTEEEFYRFRQIVINTVMATDILSKKVMAKQSVRWGCLFRDLEDDGSYSDYGPDDEGDQKSSIVVERLLLVSDIAHTMQHWYVYRKWNEKLFEECYLAFKAGRAESDPSESWYEDELSFFDTYVIPLASNMKACELFDSSCDEYVRYAKSNREQWETTGRDEVASMVERFKEIEFEVDEAYNPIPDGRIFSPNNGRPKPHRDWKKTLATFDGGYNST